MDEDILIGCIAIALIAGCAAAFATGHFIIGIALLLVWWCS